MAAPQTRGAGVVPLILDGEPGEAGEILRSLTFVGGGENGNDTTEVREDARRWGGAEAAAFHRKHVTGEPDAVVLDPAASRGYTFRIGPLTIDLLWFPGETGAHGALYYLVSRAGAPVRRLRTRGVGSAWTEADEGEPEALARRARTMLGRLRPGEVVRGAATLAERFEQEPYWQAEAAVAGAIWLVLGLTKKFVIGPVWLMPASELLLLAALFYTAPGRRIEIGLLPRTRTLPRLALALVGLINTGSLALLVHELLTGKAKGAMGHPLILAAVVIWLTNVVIFALAFWELDRGGPDRRSDPETEGDPRFLFPQMTVGGKIQEEFRPAFFDYVYTSATNATAFSPTDTMPLGALAKGLMLIQALASLTTVGLVAARAVNILAQ
jgi:hypothetical protein